jgi:hypothetical protein
MEQQKNSNEANKFYAKAVDITPDIANRLITVGNLFFSLITINENQRILNFDFLGPDRN